MRARLTPHPDFPPPAIAVEAEAQRADGRLLLTYRVTGEVHALHIPPPAPPGRADELWRHTCFEAFVAPAAGEAYCEINLSPSGQWATYRFDSYRQGMAVEKAEAALLGPLQVANNTIVLRAQVELGGLAELRGAWRLGLTAVIEGQDGTLSYWSVAHPAGRPDFHHRDCLALELAAPEGS
jgi:hypothetical protein